MNGLLLVNKPKGITSFDIIRKLRRVAGVKKIGHAGTLDPMATGLMIMLFGSACKKAQQFSKLDKTYEAVLTLGATSSTGDAEGVIAPGEGRREKVYGKEVEKVLTEFLGEIEQTPPAYSAVKIGGVRAYKLARAGEQVEMPSRKIRIYSIELLDYAYPKLKIRTRVSSGTYIRSLAKDIGESLDTGAYLSGLVRTEVGDFKLADAIGLQSVTLSEVERSLQTL